MNDCNFLRSFCLFCRENVIFVLQSLFIRKLWVEKFYRVLIENTHNALRKNCVFALIVGSQKYPLREDAIKIAKGVGFDISIFKENALPSNKSKLHETENERGETVIILKKI